MADWAWPTKNHTASGHTLVKAPNRSTLALPIKTKLQIPLPGIPICTHVCKEAEEHFTDVQNFNCCLLDIMYKCHSPI